jgi:hypothetical protein
LAFNDELLDDTVTSMLTPAVPPGRDGVLLRTACVADNAGLLRLAALDSARPLAGPSLVAEENDTIVAALCLSTGAPSRTHSSRRSTWSSSCASTLDAAKRRPPRRVAAGCSPVSCSGRADR